MIRKSIFRPFLLRQAFNFRSLSSSFPLNHNHSVPTPDTDSSNPKKPSPNSPQENLNPSDPYANYPSSFRSSHIFGFESEPEQVPVPPNVVPVKSDEEFNTALSKAEGESMPVVFYFTATWCAPCRFISPMMDELARRNPHVTTYKLDIDEEGIASTVKKLNITAVPTIHFFIEGKKTDEVVGGDAPRLVQTMNKLYQKKKDD